MSDRAAFVAAIEADPDNDLPRLVWADWLDDTGDPFDSLRAELIRLQCGPHQTGRADRLAELFVSLEKCWPPDITYGLPFQRLAHTFRRGVLSGLRLPVGAFAQAVISSVAREPLDGAALFGGSASLGEPEVFEPADFEQLISRPELRAVGAVFTLNTYYDNRRMRSLMASPHLAGLHTVLCPAADVAAVLDSPSPFRLRELMVSGHDSISRNRPYSPHRVVERIAAAPRCSSLTRLAFGGTIRLRSAEWRTLVASPHLPPTLTLEAGYASNRPRRGSELAAEVAARFPGPPPAS